MLTRQGWRRGVDVEVITEVRRRWQGNGRSKMMLTRHGGGETMLGAKFMYKPVL